MSRKASFLWIGLIAVLLPVALLREYNDAGYVIQFSRTADFSSIEAQARVKPESFTAASVAIKRLQSGDYYWRVAAYRRGEHAPFSEPVRITVP